MALNQNFNLNPYYDDFDDDKQFVKVLFRPGYAVQARELTQLQSILQDQIGKFGRHIFKNGSMVLGGEVIFENTEIYYLRLEDEDSNGNAVDVNNFIGKKITDVATQTVKALVVGVVPRDVNAAIETTFAYNTLIVKYTSSEQFDEAVNFRVDTDVAANQFLGTTISSIIKSPITESIYHSGFSSIANINDGVFFYDGYFVKVLPQTIVLDPYGVTPTYRIGLEVEEEIIDENTDTSLLDPALEASNYQAPGANRYKVSLILAKRSLTSTDDSAFINLMRVQGGAIQERVLYPQYAVLEDTLARRTFDESGNYIVGKDDFKVLFRDDQVSNGGVGFANSYNLLVSPGKAYVRGYEFETISETPIVVPRARDYSNVTNYNLTFDYQNYVDITNIQGPINLKELTSFNIHCVPVQSINNATKYSIASTEMGTIRIRSLDYLYGANSTSVANAVFRAYVFDANLSSTIGKTATPRIGFLSNVAVANSGDSAFGLPTLTVLGANTAQASVTPNVKVVSVTIVKPGYGYAVGNTFTATGGTGNSAVLYVTSVDANGNVTGVSITNAGNYTQIPTQNLNPFTSNTGTGQEFSANLRFGVSEVNITNRGANYDGQAATIAATGNGIANVVLYTTFTANANTITLDTEASVANDAYRGVRIRILGYAKEYRANSFSNTTLVVQDVANTAIREGQRVFGANIKDPVYVYTITSAANTVTLTGSVTGNAVNDLFAFIKETEFRDVETRVINNYDGSTRIAYIADSTWGNVPNTAAIYSLDFEFKDAESFVTTNIANSQILSTINISDDSKYSVLKDKYAGSFISETDFNSLLYPLPNESIKEGSISNVEFSAKQLYSKQFSSNVLTFSTDLGTQTLVNGSPLSGATAIDNFFIVLRSAGTDLANGTVINLFENDTNNVSVTTSLGISTITVRAPGAGNALVDVYAKVEYPTPQQSNIRKRKLLQQSNTQVIVSTGGEEILAPNCVVLYVSQPSQNGVQLVFNSSSLENLRTPNQPQSIYVSDVISISKILDFGNNIVDTANIAVATDLTNNFKFDNGQRDNSYEHASISLIPGKTPPSGNVVVFANFYKHENYGYFSVDSYESTDYGKIPNYTSPNSGKVYKLRDCIDFRPSRQNGLQGLAGKYNETYIGVSGTSIQLNYSFYLPRIDKLVITRDKQFEVILGQSALIPKVPKDRDDSMTLYTLIMPAYTDEVETIRSVRHQNKRYTMRDIGSIEQRVQNLEYFTTLSWLEKQAVNEQFLDDTTGLPRVKTGVVVDPFKGHKIADVTTVDYKAAIDPVIGEVRPPIETDQFRFELLDLKTDYATLGELNTTYESFHNIVVPKYTANTFVSQPQISGSEKINPFGIDSLSGSADVDETDSDFPDKKVVPVITEFSNKGLNDAWEYCSQEFREQRRLGNINSKIYQQPFLCYGREYNWWRSRNFGIQKTYRKILAEGRTEDAEEYLASFSNFYLIDGVAAESLNDPTIPANINAKLDENAFSSSLELQRRKKGAYFRGRGLRPNKKATVFLNDVNVTNYVVKPDVIQVQTSWTNPLALNWIGHWRDDFRRGEEFEIISIDTSGSSTKIARGQIDYIEKVNDNIANIHVFVSSVPGTDEISERERVILTGKESYIRTRWFGRYWWRGLRKGNNKIIAYHPGYSLVNVATSNTVQLSPKVANSNLSFTNSSTITICSGDGAGETYNVVSYNASTLTVTIQGTFEEPLSGATTTVTKPKRKKPRGVWDYVTQTRTTRNEDRSTITFGDLYTDSKGTIPGLLMVPSIIEDDDELGFTVRPRGKNILRITTDKTIASNEPTSNTNPLAQSFVVDPKIYPQGLDLTSVKLLFASKDETFGITVQIRNCTSDGVPLTSSAVGAIVPGAVTHIDSKDVRVVSQNVISKLNSIGFNPFEKDYVYSTQSLTGFAEALPNPYDPDAYGKGLEYYTEAKFGKVIHLEPGKTYAICVDTPSVDYQLYLATVGQKILGTSRTISTQPYVGTLFKTQANTTAWTPYPTQDLAFELTRATYSVPAIVKLCLLVAPVSSNTSGIQGASDYFAGVPTSNVNVNAVCVQTDENAFVNANVTYKIKTTLYDGSTTDFVPIEPGKTIEFYDDLGPRVITSNNESLIVEATLKTINNAIAPTFDVSKMHLIAIRNVMDNNSISNADIFIPSNFGQDHNVQSVVVSISGGGGTGATAVANVTSSNTIDAIYITNGGYGYTESPTITISDPNATINAEAVIIGEDQPFGGVADAKYITRKVTLADGFNGGDLRVLFSAHKARNTEIDVYYKVLSAYDADSLENKRWTKMTLIGGINNYSSNYGDFKNYIYAPGKDNIADNYINYDGWTNFKYFAIKIVMRGTNTNKVPRIKNFRAIALAELL